MWDPLEISWNLGPSSSPSVISSMPRISSDPSHLGLTHSLLWFNLVLPTKKNRYWIPQKSMLDSEIPWHSMTHNYAPCCWNIYVNICPITITQMQVNIPAPWFAYPIGSMYGIYTNIGGILMVNVTIYISYMDPMGMGDDSFPHWW